MLILAWLRDRVERDGRLARGAVADDQFALAAADGDHRVNGHDARLHRLADAFALDDARRDVFDRVKLLALDRPLAVDGLADGVDHAAEQPLAHRHGEQAAGRADLGAFDDALVVAEQDRADLGFFEVEREAEHAVGELDGLVEHHVAQAFDAGHAVADLAHDADVALGRRGLEAGDLGFDVLENRAHGR